MINDSVANHTTSPWKSQFKLVNWLSVVMAMLGGWYRTLVGNSQKRYVFL
jgi:hypothetical protein